MSALLRPMMPARPSRETGRGGADGRGRPRTLASGGSFDPECLGRTLPPARGGVNRPPHALGRDEIRGENDPAPPPPRHGLAMPSALRDDDLAVHDRLADRARHVES